MANAIEVMIQFHREWLDKNGARILTRDSGYLRGDIEEGTPEAFQQIPSSLNGLATYYGILGTIELIDGQTSGWNHISSSIDVLTREGLAIESKVGRTSLTKSVRRQVLKDAEILNDPTSGVNQIIWEFSRSATTGKVGPTASLWALLEANEIGISIVL